MEAEGILETAHNEILCGFFRSCSLMMAKEENEMTSVRHGRDTEESDNERSASPGIH